MCSVFGDPFRVLHSRGDNEAFLFVYGVTFGALGYSVCLPLVGLVVFIVFQYVPNLTYLWLERMASTFVVSAFSPYLLTSLFLIICFHDKVEGSILVNQILAYVLSWSIIYVMK